MGLNRVFFPLISTKLMKSAFHFSVKNFHATIHGISLYAEQMKKFNSTNITPGGYFCKNNFTQWDLDVIS